MQRLFLILHFVESEIVTMMWEMWVMIAFG